MMRETPHAPRFDNRVALVTGAGSGIGRASALAFARSGASVVVADIECDGGEETVALIRDLGAESQFIQVDVTNATEVASLIAQTVDLYGRLDFAHNNAGMMSSGIPLEEHDEELWNAITDLNLKGTWLCMKYEIPQMRAQTGGSIVNTSSIAGMRGAFRASAYSASKHGVIGLTRSAAQECAADGIRVNAVCPSWIDTPPIKTMLAVLPDLDDRLAKMTPLGRIGTVDEVADAVIWLCSDGAGYITGQSLVIDGGVTA